MSAGKLVARPVQPSVTPAMMQHISTYKPAVADAYALNIHSLLMYLLSCIACDCAEYILQLGVKLCLGACDTYARDVVVVSKLRALSVSWLRWSLQMVGLHEHQAQCSGPLSAAC